MATATAEAPEKMSRIPSDASIESWLTKHGVQFERVANLELARVDRAVSLHNQARIGNPVNEDLVLRYSEYMEDGDIFPPLIVYQSGAAYIVIDGNHRIAAADVSNVNGGPVEYFPAYVVIDPSPAQIMTLTFEANTKHGLPTSTNERLAQAIYMHRKGVSQPDAAALLGLTLSQLKNAWAKSEADSRFSRLGLTSRRFESLKDSGRQRLNSIRNDNAFKAAATLALDGQYSSEDIGQLAATVNKARTEKDALSIIAKERESRAGSIKSTAGGRIPTPRRVTTLLRAMTMLRRMELDALATDLRTQPKEVQLELAKAAGEVSDVMMAVIRESKRA